MFWPFVKFLNDMHDVNIYKFTYCSRVKCALICLCMFVSEWLFVRLSLSWALIAAAFLRNKLYIILNMHTTLAYKIPDIIQLLIIS